MKAIWALKPLSFDPETREILLDRCPNCESYLGWESSCEPWFCENCMLSTSRHGEIFDLRSVSMPVFEPTDPEALDYVAYMLDPVANDRRVRLPTGSAFESMSAGDVFQLAVRIASTCQRNQKPMSGLQIEPGFIEIAGRAILSWPNLFLELVESTPAMPKDGEVLGWYKAKPLRQLLYEPTLSPGIRNEIKKILEVARRTEGLSSACPSTTEISSGSDPARVGLQRPRSALFNLLRTEVVERRPYSDFEAVMTVLRDIKEVRQFSRRTGVSVPDVWRLYSSGLAPELGPTLASYGWRPKAEIDDALHSTLAKMALPGMGVGAIDLVSARFALDTEMKSSWVSILRAVVDRRLKVWRGGNSGGLIGSLFLNDYECLRSIMEQDNADPDDADVDLTQEELSMSMRKSRIYATHLVRSGVMAGPTNIRTFASLRRKWAFGFELEAMGRIARFPRASIKLRNAGIDHIDFGPAKLWAREQALTLLDLGIH
ncbi:hypothetical protein [Rhizobium johnstonii]|uniref:hypothetical protein n=1 Tax=Rhizobium johnstonii TaxID=3019933 RepID=UPI003F981DBC